MRALKSVILKKIYIYESDYYPCRAFIIKNFFAETIN